MHLGLNLSHLVTANLFDPLGMLMHALFSLVVNNIDCACVFSLHDFVY